MTTWMAGHQQYDTQLFQHRDREYIISRTGAGVVLQLGRDYALSQRTGIFLKNDGNLIVNPHDQVATFEAAQQFFSPQPATAAAAVAPAATLAPADPVDQEISQEDLVTLRELLKGRYTLVAGSVASVENTMEVTLDQGQTFRAWFNRSLQAFNFQEAEAFRSFNSKNKTGVGIAPDGKILSVFKDGKKVEDQPPLLGDRAPIIRSFLVNALESTSSYHVQHGHTIQVTLVDRGLEKIPEFHLERLAQGILAPGIRDIDVQFLNKELHGMDGIDAGGLTRELLNRLCKGLINMQSSVAFTRCESGICLPALKNPQAQVLTAQEDRVFKNLGAVLMFCYDSRSVGPFDTSAVIGRHFDDALFCKILALPFATLAIEEPDFETTLYMARRVLEKEPQKRQIIDILSKPTLSDHDFEWIETVLMPAEEEFSKADFPGGSLKEQFQNNWMRIKQKLFVMSELHQEVLPIRAIAQGMMLASVKQGAHLTQARERRWQELQDRVRPEELSERIQGCIDKETIARSIRLSPGLSVAHQHELNKKMQWLKKWITETATQAELRNFLEFATGVTSLPRGKHITICPQAVHPILPVPKAHTCSYQLEFAPFPCASLGPNYDDSTEEGFIRALGIALANPSGYQFS